MVNNTAGTQVTAEDLLVPPQQIDETLARLDAGNPSHRAVVLGAIEQLIARYILPATDLPPSPNRFFVFDLDAVAGTEIPGLVRRLFDERMPGLSKPSDDELKAALDYIDVETENEAHRDRIHLCWSANKAATTLGTLFNFLRAPLRDASRGLRSAMPQERQRLARLLNVRLPEQIEYDIESLMKLLEGHE